ncbi:fungal alpha-L-arabinofuranosidase [Penicillium hispanicum]|uniref:fungal alpha-L-arabinofuranosidase n=1 Tax=Penicillium hispanicum TaxID=1080232 RepID=UPI00253FE36F|nr:fungal alpha-L-arabinofuranosidase [Penicillium hispanicum]KAJ5591696.1 fungal alpha-L-arabinofuranosidase [Penicillium hispanicum]
MFSRRSRVTLGLVATASLINAAPCDIYSSGKTPCVAAHSTTRALYDAYTGSLYQVKRGSDGATAEIAPLSAGGVANAAAQDSFCDSTTCLITVIYDQSGRGNHLTQAPPGGFNGPDVDGYDNLASAIGAPVTLNGQKAYGVFFSPGTGYRNNTASGIATGDAAEGMYAVLDGTHYNGVCCFDYGNAETSSTDTGNGHMEAIYYGDSTTWGSGSGSGPWIMADLENGLFSGSSATNNAGDPSISYRFVTAVIKGEPDQWAIRGANAASGSLSTYYSGARPDASGYNPMSKEGAIILGIGGDNSNSAQGTFYEGVMTSGYPSDATENSVQANIVAAGYAVTSLTSGPALTVGSSISLQVTTPGYTTRYIAHNGSTVDTQVVSSSSTTTLKQQASWTVRSGLANSGCFSFESADTPGSFIRHYNFDLLLNANDDTKQFYEDATFCSQTALNGNGSSIRSWSYPTRYFRHYDDVLYAASNGGVQTFDDTASFNDDVSWVISTGFA